MSDTDHAPARPPGSRPTDPGPGRRPGPGVDVRPPETSVAPMAGAAPAARMIGEADAETRPWSAVEFLA
ncbi:hypothetical protein ACIBPB_13835 [Micromonospora sp. NPDC049836]|uniref:hypothetical protein n=1 Tax=Micromonospora sp. NPDC049836 TaxID=3364274 RepID=UPI00378C3CBC